jgi:hypothetical protein
MIFFLVFRTEGHAGKVAVCVPRWSESGGCLKGCNCALNLTHFSVYMVHDEAAYDSFTTSEQQAAAVEVIEESSTCPARRGGGGRGGGGKILFLPLQTKTRT